MLDEGIGICGKGGQSVPAGVGQPTLLVGVGRSSIQDPEAGLDYARGLAELRADGVPIILKFLVAA